jgi:hypothetical protein
VSVRRGSPAGSGACSSCPRPGFRPHGGLWALNGRFVAEILAGMLRNLDGGTWGLSWAIPILLLLAARPSLRGLLPALALTGGLLLFLVFDYLHDESPPNERIRWTTPRVSQPALSAVILAAGLATARRARDSKRARVVSASTA